MARGGGDVPGAHCSGQAGGYPSACAFRGSGQVFQRQPQAERHETDAHQVTDQHDGRHAVPLLPVMLGHQEIDIKMEGYCGKVTVGECVVILCGIEHAFNAEEAARFIVVDMDELPENIINSKRFVFSLTPPMMSFAIH